VPIGVPHRGKGAEWKRVRIGDDFELPGRRALR